VLGSDLEAVDESALQSAPDSGAVQAALYNPQVLNAASLRPGPVAPGELVAIKASGLGPAQGVEFTPNAAGGVDPLLAGSSAYFGATAGPVLYAHDQQVNAVAPWGIAGQQNFTLQMDYNGTKPFSAPVSVTAVSPGIFIKYSTGEGEGNGAIINQDGTINGPESPDRPAHPAPRGSIVAIWGTGGGVTTPAGVDGEQVKDDGYKIPLDTVSTRIGGITAKVTYAGGAPLLVSGVVQINVEVPADAPSGAAVPVQISIQGFNSQPNVTMAVQ
jgi:uncharacterized protein (TIGR03437 family)